ncbi:transglutaminase N-terminal domain-containing protein [Mycobacterium avium]|uniref:transglutaminase N-terminal domain-containing protein n=1 Tax=Mycobacterium avium TaxID=1764 RepID=UPI002406946C|nr:transglutaminase N-terminal domain-containing protein [Mycobacterium avium]
MWRLRVVHTTGYAYQSPVTASYNEARLTPRSNNRQNVILNRVETIPATRSYRYIDYWGPRSQRSTCTRRTPTSR